MNFRPCRLFCVNAFLRSEYPRVVAELDNKAILDRRVFNFAYGQYVEFIGMRDAPVVDDPAIDKHKSV